MLLCTSRSYNKFKNIRLFANVAIEEKEGNNECHNNQLKMRTVPESIKTTIEIKKYEEIPGPKGIFGIGTFYHYFPLFGT